MRFSDIIIFPFLAKKFGIGSGCIKVVIFFYIEWTKILLQSKKKIEMVWGIMFDFSFLISQ
jgi:hypothetical protein